jgi:hypothetical protein
MPSRAHKWIGRAALLSFTLSILLIDEPSIVPASDQGTHVRRRLEDDQEGKDKTAEAQAALTALEKAMGVLDEIIAAHDANDRDVPSESQGVVSSEQAADEENTADESAVAQADGGVDQQQQETDSTPQDEATDSEQQTDQPSAQEETSQEIDTASENDSVKKAAAEALGEAKNNRRDPAPQPVQSREKYL